MQIKKRLRAATPLPLNKQSHEILIQNQKLDYAEEKNLVKYRNPVSPVLY